MRDALLPPLLAALTISPCLAQGTVGVSVARNGSPVSAATTTSTPTSTPLTLRQAIDLALRDRPELAAARSEVAARRAALSQAGAYPNPVFDAELEDVREDTRTTTYRLSLPIELGGKRSARQDAARFALDAAQSRQESQCQQLRADVTAAFFNALAAQERARLAESAVELAQRGSDAARKRVVAGKASPIDETKAKVAEAGVRLEQVQARGARRSALQTLHMAIGGSRPVDHLEGQISLPLVPDSSALQQRVSGAASVRLAQLEVQRLGALARLERAKRVPDVAVGVGSKRSEEFGRSQAMLTLTVAVPIFDTNRSAELEALRLQDKARHEMDAAVARLRSDVVSAHVRLEAAAAEAQVLQQDILPGAIAVHDTSTKGFELGKFSLLEVLDSQRTLLQARSQHLKAVAEAHQAAAEIEHLLGASDAAAAPCADPPPTHASPAPSHAPRAAHVTTGQL